RGGRRYEASGESERSVRFLRQRDRRAGRRHGHSVSGGYCGRGSEDHGRAGGRLYGVHAEGSEKGRGFRGGRTSAGSSTHGRAVSGTHPQLPDGRGESLRQNGMTRSKLYKKFTKIWL